MYVEEESVGILGSSRIDILSMQERYFENVKWVKGNFCFGVILFLNVHLEPQTLRNFAGVRFHEGAFSV